MLCREHAAAAAGAVARLARLWVRPRRLAVAEANERLEREQLQARGCAFVLDIGLPPPSGQLPAHGVDTVLAIFTLSALPPEALPAAFGHLARVLRPGGQLLLRDYGRLDLKQLKFAAVAGARLGSGHGCEWYARGDGTTAFFFTTEAVAALAAQAGLVVEQLAYDKRMAVNRATKTRMHRVWVVATLRKPPARPPSSEASGRAACAAARCEAAARSYRPSPGAAVALAAAATAVLVVAHAWARRR